MATTRTLTIFINGKEVENSLKSIRAEYVKLYNETAKMNASSEGYAEKVAELKRTKEILDEHRAQLSGTAKAWDKLKEGAAMAAPYIAGAFSAFSVGEKIINSAQAASDKWEETLTGLKWGLDAVTKSIASFDFTNFFESITKSINAGREYAKVLDDLADRNRAFKVSESGLRIEIEKLERVRDNVLLSNQERINAAMEIDRLERESMQKNNDIKKTAFENEVMRLQTLTGLTEEQIKTFIKEYNEQKTLREEAERYGETLKEIKALKRNAVQVSPEGVSMVDQTMLDKAEELQKKANSTSESVKNYYDILKKFGKTTDEELDKAVQAWVDMNGAELTYMQNTQKNERKINELKKEFSDEEKKRAEEAKKRAEALAKKLEEIQYKLNQYNKAAVLIELEDAHRKYRELEKEAAGNADAIIKIKQLEQQEILQINDKYKKQLAEDTKKMADEFDKLLDADSKAFLDHAIKSKELAQQNEVIVKRWLAKFREGLKEGNKRDIFGMTEEDWQKLKNDFQDIVRYADLALSTFSAYSNYLTSEEENELRRSEKVNNEKKAQLESRLKAGLVSEKVYNRSIANMDADLDEKRRKIANEQARREKSIRIFESIINTASAIVEALPNIPLSIAVGIAGAAQTALIAATEIPEYAAGGRIPKKTLLIAGEAGEEGILSNRTLTNPTTGPIANWLLDTQQGLSPRFPTTAIPVTPSVNSYGIAYQGQGNQAQPQVIVQPTDNSELIAELKKMNEYLAEPKNRQAYISRDILVKDTNDENFRKSIQKLK